MTAVRWRRIATWYLIALGGTGLVGLLWGPLGADHSALIATTASAAAMFSPLVATAILQARDGERPLRGIGAAPVLSRWLLVAIAVPYALVALTLVISPLLPGVSWDWAMHGMFDRLAGSLSPEQVQAASAQVAALPVHPLLLSLPQIAVAGATLNALFAFGEEIGWRGWLQRELAPLGFWRASLLAGSLWGLWHAPLILHGHNYPDHRVVGVLLFTVVCALLAPLLSAVRVRGGTVWAAAILHGTFNAGAGAAMLVVQGPDLLVGLQGVPGLVAIATADLVLLAVVGRSGVVSRLSAEV
ncbi:MAG: CPBP family intramembrane metalloprotease [Deltaproteobacteria bacterium]|nr:CPBP family intramembrane metalloprotease [Deltaproteobacteria bacterium]